MKEKQTNKQNQTKQEKINKNPPENKQNQTHQPTIKSSDGPWEKKSMTESLHALWLEIAGFIELEVWYHHYNDLTLCTFEKLISEILLVLFSF